MALVHGTRGLLIDDVTLLNSPNHNIMLQDSLHVRIRRLRVHAPGSSPNTDGVNFCGGTDQIIEDSHISNGDDCVSIVPSWWTLGMGYGGNVVVRNVTCENGHGVSIGSVSHGTVTNATVEDIRFNLRLPQRCTHQSIPQPHRPRVRHHLPQHTADACEDPDRHHRQLQSSPTLSAGERRSADQGHHIRGHPRHGECWRRRKVRLLRDISVHGNHPAPGSAATCGRRGGELQLLLWGERTQCVCCVTRLNIDLLVLNYVVHTVTPIRH